MDLKGDYMRRFLVLFKNVFSIPKRLFSKVSVISILQDSVVDKNAAICSKTMFYRSKIEKYSYIGRNCFITDTNIGKFTSIASNCYIGGATHPLNWVSTSPTFHFGKNVLRKNFANNDFELYRETNIGNDVWIGNGAMIKAGVTVSDGAVIGMGAIVTKDVGPYEIWGGNPARLIRKRFDDETIEKLLKIKWWNLNDTEIEKFTPYFTDVENLITKVDD